MKRKRPSRKSISETDVAKPIVEWLAADGWEVYQEVQYSRYGSVHDIVAKKGKILWCVETKTTLSFSVIEQAWRAPFPLRSVGIPIARWRRKDPHDFPKMVCERLGIGVFEVSPGLNRVAGYQPPDLIRTNHEYAKCYILPHLVEGQKSYKMAGGTAGGHLTPYRETMDRVLAFIGSHPGCALKDIFAHLGSDHHYANDVSARSAIPNALRKFEADRVRIETKKNRNVYFTREAK